MVEMDDDWEMDNGMGGGWIAAITPLDEDNPLILIQDHTESSGELGEESRPIGIPPQFSIDNAGIPGQALFEDKNGSVHETTHEPQPQNSDIQMTADMNQERRESQPQEDVLMGDVRKPDSFPDNVMGYNALDNFIRWDPDNSSECGNHPHDMDTGSEALTNGETEWQRGSVNFNLAKTGVPEYTTSEPRLIIQDGDSLSANHRMVFNEARERYGPWEDGVTPAEGTLDPYIMELGSDRNPGHGNQLLESSETIMTQEIEWESGNPIFDLTNTNVPDYAESDPALIPEMKEIDGYTLSETDADLEICSECENLVRTTKCNEATCSVRICTVPTLNHPCLIRSDSGPWYCPYHASKETIDNSPKSLRPLLLVLMGSGLRNDSISHGEIDHCLNSAFQKNTSMLKKVEILGSSLSLNKKRSEIKTWMKKYPSSSILIILGILDGVVNTDTSVIQTIEAIFEDSYSITLSENGSPIRGLINLGSGTSFHSVEGLESWCQAVRRVHLTWVVGFTNPGLDLGVVWHLISQFMLEAYRSRDGESILKALTWCFISPSVMHHTGILFIELPKDCYNARVRKISLCAPNTPWGFSLEDCPVCGSDGYLRVFKKTPLACRVLCKECNGEGLVTHPTHLRTSFLKQFYLKNKGVEYVQVPFPGSPPLSISKFSGMKGQINVQNVQPCSICAQKKSGMACSQPGCTVFLCIGKNGDGCLDLGNSDMEWLCFNHSNADKGGRRPRLSASSYWNYATWTSCSQRLVIKISLGAAGDTPVIVASMMEGTQITSSSEDLVSVSLWTERHSTLAHVIVILQSNCDMPLEILRRTLNTILHGNKVILTVLSMVPYPVFHSHLEKLSGLTEQRPSHIIWVSNGEAFIPSLIPLIFDLMRVRKYHNFLDVAEMIFRQPFLLRYTDIVLASFEDGGMKKRIFSL